MIESRIHGPIGEAYKAYKAYDSEPRVSGPDDFEAFADAVEGYRNRLLRNLIAATDDITCWGKSASLVVYPDDGWRSGHDG